MDKKIRIVIIEDHKLLRVGLKSLFENTNDIVVFGESETGRDGISKVQLQKPDIVLIDLGLPDISGLEVIKELASLSKDTKIIVRLKI